MKSEFNILELANHLALYHYVKLDGDNKLIVLTTGTFAKLCDVIEQEFNCKITLRQYGEQVGEFNKFTIEVQPKKASNVEPSKELLEQIQSEYMSITDFSGGAVRKLAHKYNMSTSLLLQLIEP